MTISGSPSEITPSELWLSSSVTTDKIIKLSNSSILKIGEISRVSNTTILNENQEFTKLSDSAIFREGFDDKEILSDVRIKNTDSIELLSDIRIKNIYEKTPTSISTIFSAGYGLINTTSNERIVAEGTIVLPPVYSDSRILRSGFITIDKLSDTFIKLNIDLIKTSDSTIFNSGYGNIEILSDTAIFRANYGDITTLSNSAIYLGDIEFTILSDTVIKRPAGYLYPFQRSKIDSNSRIIKTNELPINSLTFVSDTQEFTKLSDTLVIHEPDITIPSDSSIVYFYTISIKTRTRIIASSQEVSEISDSAIFRTAYNTIDKISDTQIFREPIINVGSNSRILNIFELTTLSDTYVINEGTEITTISDTTIFNAGYETINIESQAVIKNLAYKTTMLSDARVKRVVILNTLSDASIRRDRSNMRAIFQKGRQL